MRMGAGGGEQMRNLEFLRPKHKLERNRMGSEGWRIAARLSN